MEALQATGYDGLLSLEIFNDQFRAGSAHSVASTAAAPSSISWTSCVFAPASRTSRCRRCRPAPTCLGTEFIEFTVDEDSEPRFETLLRSLGFVKAGVHKSKAVTRWSQGAINVVINTDKEGFAHSYNITHGTSVCAIGFMVDDASKTLDRAQRLLDQPFRQAVGPGELEIPAVRGVGGSLLYFIDPKSDLARVWDVEFAPTGEDARKNGAGLTTVDHISQSMHYEEMLTWLLFYTSLLDLIQDARAGRAGPRRPRQKPGRAGEPTAPCGWC